MMAVKKERMMMVGCVQIFRFLFEIAPKEQILTQTELNYYANVKFVSIVVSSTAVELCIQTCDSNNISRLSRGSPFNV